MLSLGSEFEERIKLLIIVENPGHMQLLPSRLSLISSVHST